MIRDLILGSVLLAISGVYYLGAAAIPDSQLADTVGPKGLPGAYAILLATLALLLIARAVRARRRLLPVTEPGRTDPASHTIGRVAALLAVGIVYIVVVPLAGYLISIAALIVATARYHAGRASPGAGSLRERRRAATQVLLVGITGAGLLWLVFVALLRIPQPAGIWPSLW